MKSTSLSKIYSEIYCNVLSVYNDLVKKKNINYWNSIINANLIKILADYIFYIENKHSKKNLILKFNEIIYLTEKDYQNHTTLKSIIKDIFFYIKNFYKNNFLKADFIQIGSNEKNIKYFLKKNKTNSLFVNSKKILIKKKINNKFKIEYYKEIDLFLSKLTKKFNLKNSKKKNKLFKKIKNNYIYFSSLKDIKLPYVNQKKIIFNVPRNIWNRCFVINYSLNQNKKIYGFDHGPIGIFSIIQKLSPYHEIRFSDYYCVNSDHLKKNYEQNKEIGNFFKLKKIVNINYLNNFKVIKHPKYENNKKNVLLIGYPHRYDGEWYPYFNYHDGSDEVYKIEKSIIDILKEKKIKFTYQVHPERKGETIRLFKKDKIKFSFNKFEEIYSKYSHIVYPSVTTSTFDIGILNKKKCIGLINSKEKYILKKKYQKNIFLISWKYKNYKPLFNKKKLIDCIIK